MFSPALGEFQWFLTLLFIVVFVLYLIAMILLPNFYYSNSTYKHFLRENIPHRKAMPWIQPFSMIRSTYPESIRNVYESLGSKPYGYRHISLQSIVVLKDLDLINNVLKRHFEYFSDRREVFGKDMGPLWKDGMPHLTGHCWEVMKRGMISGFQPTNMKSLAEFVSKCCLQVMDCLEKNLQKPSDLKCIVKQDKNVLKVEMKELFTRYATDVCASVGFGKEVDSLANANNKFYEMGERVMCFKGISGYRWIGYITMPKILTDLGIGILPEEVSSYFADMITGEVQKRSCGDVSRPDILQVLINMGNINYRGIVAQILTFFLPGFDTTSTLLSFVSYQLAVNWDMQMRMLDEINECLKQNGGKITLEAVNSMKYLDMFISETLRLYPITASIDRTCVRHYVLDADPPCELRPGSSVMIPVYGLHHDDKYFPDPERFDPERFSEKNRRNIKPGTYLPFGIGPRSCLGSNFALLETKMILVNLLSRFCFKVIPQTPSPIKIVQKGFNTTVEGGFWLGLVKRSGSCWQSTKGMNESEQ